MVTKKFEKAIELKNDGELSVFFVGCGNAFSKKNLQTNIVIVKGNDHLVVDCGTLFSYAWETIYNSKITDIENILLTHPHADHIGGVEELILTGRYVKKQKLNIIITDTFKRLLWNESLKGGVQYSEDGRMTFEDYFNQIQPKHICKKPQDVYEANIGSINIKLFRSYHVTDKKHTLRNKQYSTGLIIDNKILFTGDTQFKPEQLKWILDNYNIEYIFQDCDMAGYSEGVHASYKQLCTLPEEVKNKMLLCHYSVNPDDYNVKEQGFLGFVNSGTYYQFK